MSDTMQAEPQTSETTVGISWDTVHGASSYLVERNRPPTSNWCSKHSSGEITPTTRKAYFRRMERKVAFARRGNKRALQAELYAERLKDLRAVAERSLWPQDPPPQMELTL